MWEELGKENIPDCFIDYFCYQKETFNLIQELILIIQKSVNNNIIEYNNSIIKLFSLQNEKNTNKQIQIIIKSIYQEYYNEIFESENNKIKNEKEIINNFCIYYKTQINIYNKNDEFEDLIKSRSFINLINLIKKILLYIEFHDPSLIFSIQSHNERKYEINNFKNSDCLCVEGFSKIDKKCLILINPPKMKNGYNYQNLKPIVMLVNSNIENENKNNKIQKNKKEFLTYNYKSENESFCEINFQVF